MKKKLLIAGMFCAVVALCIFAQGVVNGFSWAVYDDTANGGSSVITMKSTTEKIDGKEVYAVTFTGKVTTKYQYGFAGAVANPDDATLAALKSGKGISFETAGDGKKYRVRIETADITDYDYFGKEFVASKNAQEIVVPYTALTQEGWGAKKKFDPSKIVKVSFQTIGQPISSFEFKIIDLKVVQ